MDKSEACADAPCGGVAVAGSSMTMRRQETSRWRSEARAGHRAVEKGGPDAWANAGPRYDPLLAPRRDGVEFVGISGKINGWDESTSAESRRSLGGRSDMWRHRAKRMSQNHRAERVGGSLQNCPHKPGLAVFPKPHPEGFGGHVEAI